MATKTAVKKRARGINYTLLRRVKRHILGEPRRFLMRAFVETPQGNRKTYLDDSYGKRQRFANCNTAACIGGWAAILNTAPQKARAQQIAKIAAAFDHPHEGDSIEVAAMKALRLNPEQSYRLFYMQSWPSEQRDAFVVCRDETRRAQIAAERIDIFIRSKGRK